MSFVSGGNLTARPAASLCRRALAPLTNQLVRAMTGLLVVSASRAKSSLSTSRPANRAGRSTLSPRAINAPSASKRSRSLPLFPSRETERCSWPSRIRSINSLKTLFGPSSMNTRAPSAYICSISFTNSTGLSKCRATWARTSSSLMS